MDELTERGRLSLLLARQEAGRTNAPAIGALHLLAGLLREEDSTAAELLTNHGVRLDAVRAAAAETGADGHGETPGTHGDPPLAPVARRILDRAFQEARWQELEHAGTEHVLLAMLHEADGEAIRILLDAGLSESRLHEELVRRARRRR